MIFYSIFLYTLLLTIRSSTANQEKESQNSKLIENYKNQDLSKILNFFKKKINYTTRFSDRMPEFMKKLAFYQERPFEFYRDKEVSYLEGWIGVIHVRLQTYDTGSNEIAEKLRSSEELIRRIENAYKILNLPNNNKAFSCVDELLKKLGTSLQQNSTLINLQNKLMETLAQYLGKKYKDKTFDNDYIDTVKEQGKELFNEILVFCDNVLVNFYKDSRFDDFMYNAINQLIIYYTEMPEE